MNQAPDMRYDWGPNPGELQPQNNPNVQHVPINIGNQDQVYSNVGIMNKREALPEPAECISPFGGIVPCRKRRDVNNQDQLVPDVVTKREASQPISLSGYPGDGRKRRDIIMTSLPVYTRSLPVNYPYVSSWPYTTTRRFTTYRSLDLGYPYNYYL